MNSLDDEAACQAGPLCRVYHAGTNSAHEMATFEAPQQDQPIEARSWK